VRAATRYDVTGACVYAREYVFVLRFAVSAATRYDVAGVCVRVFVFVCGCG